MKHMMMTVGMLAAIAGGTYAAPLNTAQVGANANWVLHLDVDALKTTQVGKIILQRTTTGADNNKLNALAAILGFDLRKDLAGITLYAPPGLPNGEGAIVLNGTFSGQQLETFVKADEAYTSESYKGTTIHSWTDKKKNNKRTFGTVLAGSTIVMSDSSTAVKTTLDAIGGQGANLATENGNQLVLTGAKGAVLVAAADMTKTKSNKPNAQTLKQAKSGSASIREEGTDAVASISLVADTAENAQLMNNAVRGLLALMQLDEKTDQKTKDALAATKVDLNGSSISVTIRVPAQTLADALEKQIKADDAKKAAAAAASGGAEAK